MNKKQNLAFIIVILAITIILVLYKNFIYTADGSVAVVSAQETTTKISLSDNGTHIIDGGLFPVQLIVENGTVRFANSQCPDHVCEGFGKLAKEGDQAICAPARVVVSIEQ